MLSGHLLLMHCRRQAGLQASVVNESGPDRSEFLPSCCRNLPVTEARGHRDSADESLTVLAPGG